jgi:hypothetical protein
MKLIGIVLFLPYLLFVTNAQSPPKFDEFQKIATFRIESNTQIKEVYFAKNFKASWMSANMFCLSKNMEYLRIESQPELLEIKKALKLIWLEFDSQLFVDGIFTIENKWKFLGNNVDLDPAVYDIKKPNNPCSSCTGKFIALQKTEKDIEVSLASETERQFLCQKIMKPNYYYEDENLSLKVNVIQRMFEEIGRDDTSTYFINRNYNLQPLHAENFCAHFGMKLTTIEFQKQFDDLKSFISKSVERYDKNFMIGGTRSTLNDFLKAYHFIDEDLNYMKPRECVAVYISPRLIQKFKISFFNCNERQAHLKMNFICELYRYDQNGDQVPLGKQITAGMKYIGTNTDPNTKYYVNDAIFVTSWFEAFSYCKNLGMDLYSPRDKNNKKQIIEFLENKNLSSNFFIGGSTIGTEVFWYSTRTGEKIDADCSGHTFQDFAGWTTQCLGLAKTGDKYEYEALNCGSGSQNFICESIEMD